jgi:hypothetical protein
MVTAGINDMIKENGHDALHLPSHYSDLHPNELVYVDIKNREAHKCIWILRKFQCFTTDVSAEYTKEKCKNCCFHMKSEREYWQQDGLKYEAVNNTIIHTGASSDYTSTDEFLSVPENGWMVK